MFLYMYMQLFTTCTCILCFSDEEEEDNKAGTNHTHTSSQHASTTGSGGGGGGEQPSQERQYGSKVTGQSAWENGGGSGGENSISTSANSQFGQKPYVVKVLVDDYDDDGGGGDGSDTEAHESLAPENGDEGAVGSESLPHDLSMKRVEGSSNGEAAGMGSTDSREGLTRVHSPISSSLSEQLADMFTCQVCKATHYLFYTSNTKSSNLFSKNTEHR